MLGLQRTDTDDSLQTCSGTSGELEALITQRKTLLIVYSLFDPITLFAPFLDTQRQLVSGQLMEKTGIRKRSMGKEQNS